MTLRNKLIHLGGYFFSSATTAAVSFFSIPLLIRALGTEQFGRWSLLEPLQLLLSQVMLLGLNYGIIKQVNFDKYPAFFTYKRLLIGAQPALIIIPLSSFFILPFFAFSRHESIWFSLLIYSESIIILSLAGFRAANEVRGYAIASIVRGIIFMLALAVTISVGFPLISSIHDVLEWRFAAAVSGVILSFIFIRTFDTSNFFDGKVTNGNVGQWYSNAVRYGFPILVTGLLTQIIEFADRYILKAYFDYVTLAHYVIYLKIAAFLNPLIIAPFSLWWPTERFRRQNDPDGGSAFFRRISLQVLFILLLAGGVLWLISPWLISWFAPGIPLAPFIILLLIGSVVFMGMQSPLNISLLDEGRTHLNIYGVLCAAVIHLVLCFVFIPYYGINGAAISTAMSYLAYTLMLNIISQRYHKVPFAYSKMLFLVLISFAELILLHSLLVKDNVGTYILKVSLYSLIFPLSASAILWKGNALRKIAATIK